MQNLDFFLKDSTDIACVPCDGPSDGFTAVAVLSLPKAADLIRSSTACYTHGLAVPHAYKTRGGASLGGRAPQPNILFFFVFAAHFHSSTPHTTDFADFSHLILCVF